MTETIPEERTPEELRSKLDQLRAMAMQQYSLKNYNAAAEAFSEAAEVQDQIKKRKVAGAAGSSATGVANGASGAGSDALKDGEQKLAEDVVKAVVEDKDGMKAEEPATSTSSKPFFQITGDENWTDSEEEDEQADAEAEEEEDDFAIAYEILDTARILLGRKLEAVQQAAGKNTTEQPDVRQLRERLADTHDLQAEISLENGRFQDAINDTRDALKLKLDLYPEESSLIAEAHFKLSLALEFASVTSTADGADGEADKTVAQVDEKMRHEAALEMEKAIASCKLRISKEEASFASLDAAKAEERKKSVADVKEMVADMEQRLIDLRNPAVSLSGAGAGPAGAHDVAEDPLRGVLGAMLGESKVEQQRRVAEATEKANDLTGLVKHRKKAKAEVVEKGANGVAEGKGKRKADEVDAEGVEGAHGKKTRVEDA